MPLLMLPFTLPLADNEPNNKPFGPPISSKVEDTKARMSRQEFECRRQVSLLEARLLETGVRNSRRRDLLQLQVSRRRCAPVASTGMMGDQTEGGMGKKENGGARGCYNGAETFPWLDVERV